MSAVTGEPISTALPHGLVALVYLRQQPPPPEPASRTGPPPGTERPPLEDQAPW